MGWIGALEVCLVFFFFSFSCFIFIIILYIYDFILGCEEGGCEEEGDLLLVVVEHIVAPVVIVVCLRERIGDWVSEGEVYIPMMEGLVGSGINDK